MNIAILLSFLGSSLISVNAVTKCCPGKNIMVNGTCLDGSNLTALNCKITKPMGPAFNPPVTLEVDADEELTITDEEETGYYTVAPDKYCITSESENSTEFAIVCFESDAELPSTATRVLHIIKLFCAIITVLFLLAILIIYAFISELQDIEGKCILNIVTSICVAILLVTFSPLIAIVDSDPCDTGAFIYYTATLSFMNWLSVISFHLWRITIRPIFQNHIEWFFVYCCYGYGLPLIILITALIMHHSQERDLEVGENQCLFDGNLAVWAYSYGPIIITILISIIFQFWAAKKIWWDIDSRIDTQHRVRLQKKSLMYMHLLLVLGLMQILDMLPVLFPEDNVYLEYLWDLNDCRNLLIGGIIFFILVALRNKVLKALAKKGLFRLQFPKKWEKLIDEESGEVEYEVAALTRDSTGL